MERLRREPHMLLLICHPKKGNAMPHTVAQPTAWDLHTRAVVADDGVLDTLTDQGGASLDGGIERALGEDERRIALARHCRLGLHRHLRLCIECTHTVLPICNDEEACDRDEERVVHRMPVLALGLLLDDELAVLAPIRVLAKLSRRNVLLELAL
eukprot:7379638-Prymnesium_polylepis.2